MIDEINIDLVERLYKHDSVNFFAYLQLYRSIMDNNETIVRNKQNGKVYGARVPFSDETNDDRRSFETISLYSPSHVPKKEFKPDIYGSRLFASKEFCGVLSVIHDTVDTFDFLINYEITEDRGAEYYETVFKNDSILALKYSNHSYIIMHDDKFMRTIIGLPFVIDIQYVDAFEKEFNQHLERAILLHKLSGEAMPTLFEPSYVKDGGATTDTEIVGDTHTIHMAARVSKKGLPSAGRPSYDFIIYRDTFPVSVQFTIRPNSISA